VVEADRGDFIDPEECAGCETPVSGNQLQFAINQKWNIEAECLNAARDLLNLLFRMDTRILGIRLKFSNVPINNC
jgi:hypothetical protein